MAEHAESTANASFADRSLEDILGVRVMTITHAQGTFISWVTDILVFVVVINLFDEFFNDHIHFGSFWISLLAAVLFKLLLFIVGKVEKHVHHGLSERGFAIASIVGAFLVLFVGKLLIIKIIDELFEEVHMHGLIYEAGMILLMLVGSFVVWRIFEMLGKSVPEVVTQRAAA